MRYAISEYYTNAAVNALHYFGLDLTRLREVELLDADSALEICDHDFNYPLFLENKNTYFAHQSNLNCIPAMRSRLLEISQIDSSFSLDDNVEGYQWGNGYPANEKDLEVCAGLILLTYVQEKIFETSYEQFGFRSFNEFISVCSAHLVNLRMAAWCSELAPGWRSKHPDGREFINRYARDVHGDFRFRQYDVTPGAVQSPWEDTVPFYPTKESTLYAYHSVECAFFATILRFCEDNKYQPPVLSRYEQYIQGLVEKGADIGPFADAGSYRALMEYHQLTSPIPTVGSATRSLHRLPKEYSGAEIAYRNGDYLEFQPSGVRFILSDTEDLIMGLHESCRHGFGRTTLENLVGFYQQSVSEKFDDQNEDARARCRSF